MTKVSETNSASKKKQDAAAQKNLMDALGYIENSSLKAENKDLSSLLDAIKKRLNQVKSIKMTAAQQVSFKKQAKGGYFLEMPRSVAQANSFMVYHALLGYFLDKVKVQNPAAYQEYELNDFTSALQIESHDTKKFQTDRSASLSIDDLVMEALHDGPPPKAASDLPPLEDPSANNIPVKKLNANMDFVKKLQGIYPDEKQNMVYWRPFATEMNKAVTTNRKEELAEILKDALNAFAYILTRPAATKLKRLRNEGQSDYFGRIKEKIEKDFLKFVVKYINIRENGDQALKPNFIQAINLIKAEDLDTPANLVSLASVLDKFSKAQISPEAAEYDQANLLAIEDQGLANAPRIAQSTTMGAARLGITDQSGSSSTRTAVALIGGPQSQEDSSSKKALEIDMAFLDLVDSYGFRFNDLREGIVTSLKQAIEADATDLSKFLPREIDDYLDKAITRMKSPDTISPVANEAKELLKVFAEAFSSKEVKDLLAKNHIQINPTQFFISQIMLRYFNDQAETRKEFYSPVLQELESEYIEFNGITALMNEAGVELAREEGKAERQEQLLDIEQFVQARKAQRLSIVSGLGKNPKTPALKIMAGFQAASRDDLNKFMKKQDFASFVKRFSGSKFLSEENSMVIDNNLEEYKLDFVELVTGITVLSPLNSSIKALNGQIPVVMNGEGRLVSKEDLISIVKASLTRKLMRAVHADNQTNVLANLFEGVDDLDDISSEIYDFLNSRQDLLEVGTAWSNQESEKLLSISSKLADASIKAKEFKDSQTVRISKEREEKLEKAASSNEEMQAQLARLNKELSSTREVVVDLIKILSANKRPSNEELQLLLMKVQDQSSQDTVLALNQDTKVERPPVKS